MRLLAVLIGFVFGTTVLAFELKDDKGVMVHFERPPVRIVSLLPSITESVCTLGKCELLVGVDRYSNAPAAVLHLLRLGGGLDPNVEAIVALKPDVVLVGASPRATERLRALGLTVFSMEAESYADVQRLLETLSILLNVPMAEAKAVWQKINDDLTTIARRLPHVPPTLRVYFEVSDVPFAAGPNSFIGETLRRLGVENILSPSLGPFPKINPELVVRANPDVVMMSHQNYHGMSERPGWSDMRAIRDGRVCVFKEQEADVIVRPGPRIAEGAEIIAQCLLEKINAASAKVQGQ